MEQTPGRGSENAPRAGFHTCFFLRDKKAALVMHKEGRTLKSGGAFHCRMPVSPFVSLSGGSACRHNGGDKAKRAQALHSHVRNHVACRRLSVGLGQHQRCSDPALRSAFVDLRKRYDLAAEVVNSPHPLLGFTGATGGCGMHTNFIPETAENNGLDSRLRASSGGFFLDRTAQSRQDGRGL